MTFRGALAAAPRGNGDESNGTQLFNATLQRLGSTWHCTRTEARPRAIAAELVRGRREVPDEGGADARIDCPPADVTFPPRPHDMLSASTRVAQQLGTTGDS